MKIKIFYLFGLLILLSSFVYADTLPEDARLIWLGTNASIHTDWGRDKNFDDKFLQGSNASYTGEVDGGVLNHTHDLFGFTAIGTGHTHGSAGVNQSSIGTAVVHGADSTGGNAGDSLRHDHLSGRIESEIITYDESTTSINTSSSIPQFVRAIILQPDNPGLGFPAGACAYTDTTDIPLGFEINESFNNSYILGALPGGDGGITGGNLNHTHNESIPSLSTADLHNHPTSTSGQGFTLPPSGSIPNVIERWAVHHDVFTFNTNSGPITGNLEVNVTNNDPEYIKLMLVCNVNGTTITSFDNIIIPFINTTENIPNDWIHADGVNSANTSNKQIKITSGIEGVNDTGGDNFHNHTNANRFNASRTHHHNASDGFNSAIAAQSNGFVGRWLSEDDGHEHEWMINNKAPTIHNGTVDMNKSDKRYNRRTVIFIKKAESGVDVSPPLWSNNVSNNTVAGRDTLFSVHWTDDVALASYIFSFDNGTGQLINDSSVVFTGTANDSNVSKLINSTIGAFIRWQVFANDSSNNMNQTPIFSFNTTADNTCSCPGSGNWNVLFSDNCVINEDCLIPTKNLIIDCDAPGSFTVNATVAIDDRNMNSSKTCIFIIDPGGGGKLDFT